MSSEARSRSSSRRTVLRTAGVAIAGAFAGCTALDRGAEGHVQLKSISGVTENEGRSVEVSVLGVDASFSPDSEPPEVRYLDDAWADRFDAPREPAVSDALHDDLIRTFDRVRYAVGVCSPSWADDGESVGCYNVATTRENFNRVQVHDRVRASSDGTSLTVHSVDGTWTFDSE